MPRLVGARTWKDDEPLECVSVVPDGPGVVSFSFRSPSGAWFDYQPGQFLTLELPLPGGKAYRTYTISSSPSRPLSITLTVKAAGASVGTRWMLDHITEGTKVKAIGPGGIFVPDVPFDRKLLLISAGSGVTPMMSITTYRWDLGGAPDICFVQCARRPSELVFRRHLEHMASRVPSIQLHYVVREDDPHGAWSGYRGQFNQLMLGLMAPDYLEREIYCCGPESFMQAVRDMLIGFGYDMDHYHQETFTAPVLTEADAPVLDDVVPDPESSSEVIFSRGGASVICAETDTILTASRGAGLNIPSGCNFGICGTCKVRKLAGEVHMVHNGGISEEDIEAGYILACCSHPMGKVEIDA
ncbi:hybrid-cluster NAD(P)-dependent oxidoreductase [Amaricoccus solimangrovi]|uniref:Hybrid-cluster NAD(P)-dependent oxidoreductase n=2 Tax=Amaricoccus solimangrovi TaxID=2589815 RepID=A0A501WHY3_9RHOB|nr:hybrid-cluster NAD(P)-dependent oxidoreductase [Amaricoccus solimangrovi]